MFKILDRTGGEVSAEQQAIFNKISTNNSDGYVQGYKNNFSIAKATSNSILVETGIISLQGIRIINDAAYTITVSATPQQATAYHTVLKYTHFTASEKDTYEFINRPIQSLKQDNLYGGGNNLIYEVELCQYTLTANGITELKSTLPKLTYSVGEIEHLLEQANNNSSVALVKATNAETTAAKAERKAQDAVNNVTERMGSIVKENGQSVAVFNGDKKLNKDNPNKITDLDLFLPTKKGEIKFGYVYSDTLNIPSWEAGYGACLMLSGIEPDRFLQIMTGSSYGDMWYRGNLDGRWSEWKKVATDKDDIIPLKSNIEGIDSRISLVSMCPGKTTRSIPLDLNSISQQEYVAPANGWYCLDISSGQNFNPERETCYNKTKSMYMYSSHENNFTCIIPCEKGDTVVLDNRHILVTNYSHFIYAKEVKSR